MIEGVEDIFVDAYPLRYVEVKANESDEKLYDSRYPPKYNKKNLSNMLQIGYEPSTSWTSSEVTIRKRYPTSEAADHHLDQAVESENDALSTTYADELLKEILSKGEETGPEKQSLIVALLLLPAHHHPEVAVEVSDVVVLVVCAVVLVVGAVD